MYPCEQTEGVSRPAAEDALDEYLVRVGTELEKKSQFLHFLQKELSAARTETEKEAVLSILLRTKIQIRALERELRSCDSSCRNVRPIPHYVGAALRVRRLQ